MKVIVENTRPNVIRLKGVDLDPEKNLVDADVWSVCRRDGHTLTLLGRGTIRVLGTTEGDGNMHPAKTSKKSQSPSSSVGTKDEPGKKSNR